MAESTTRRRTTAPQRTEVYYLGTIDNKLAAANFTLDEIEKHLKNAIIYLLAVVCLLTCIWIALGEK